jgi:8-oxo-dGTP pyrophosphatase MutT (NUDIX family)
MSDYVANIRQKIGRDLLLLQAASVLAFDDDGRVLWGQSASGTWSTIGGAIEPGEAPADAALREFWEETGAHAEIVRLLGAFGGPEFFITYPNGDQVAYTSIAFEVRIASGEPAPDKVELQRLAWFSPSEVSTLPMTPNNRIVTSLALTGRERATWRAPTWVPPQT